jgi:hypothetical protein
MVCVCDIQLALKDLKHLVARAEIKQHVKMINMGCYNAFRGEVNFDL